MICLPTYNTEEEIPKKLKDEFEEVDGKWQLKKSAIPGAGEIFNDEISKVQKNASKAIRQKTAANTRAAKLQDKLDLLQDKVEDMDDDSVILSKEEAAEYNQLKEFGSAKEVGVKLTEHKELKSFKEAEEEKTEIANIASAAGVNSEVLQSWKRDAVEGKNIDSFEIVTEKDGDGNEVKKAYVKVKSEKDGKEQVESFDLVAKAKEMLPDWKFNALTSVNSNQQNNNNANQQQTNGTGAVPENSGVVLPSNVSSSNNTNQNNNNNGDVFDNFESSRNKVSSPFRTQPATK